MLADRLPAPSCSTSSCSPTSSGPTESESSGDTRKVAPSPAPAAARAPRRDRRGRRGGQRQALRRAAEDEGEPASGDDPGVPGRRARTAPGRVDAPAGGRRPRLPFAVRWTPPANELRPSSLGSGRSSGDDRTPSDVPPPAAHGRRPRDRGGRAPEGDPGPDGSREHHDDAEPVRAPFPSLGVERADRLDAVRADALAARLRRAPGPEVVPIDPARR